MRGSDAHAWTEVWFAGIGWVPFDPTANVPLAGADEAKPTLWEWFADHALLIGLVVVALGLIGFSAWRLLRRFRRDRATGPRTWACDADAALVKLGERVGRPRGPGETATGYAAVLAHRYGEPRLADAGRTIDDGLYAPVSPSVHDQLAVEQLLQALATADPPDPPPPPPPANVVWEDDVLA